MKHKAHSPQPTAHSPKIAVITPTYNRPVELGYAMRSVLQQTRLPDELWIVGDKCDKLAWREVLKLVKGFRKVEPSILVRAYNLKHPGRDVGSTPKNYALMHTRADLIAYLDDDNRWLPTHLEELENALLENDADLAWCGSVCYSEDAKERWAATAIADCIKLYHEHKCNKDGLEVRSKTGMSYVRIPPDVPRYATIDTSEILHTREALDLLGLPEGTWWRSHMYATDWDLVERLLKAGAKCVSVKKPLCEYTIRNRKPTKYTLPGVKHAEARA